MWIDLTQPFHPEIPHSSSLPSPEVETLSDVETDGANVQRYAAPTHVGTHVDAPRHFVPGGATIEAIPLDRFAGDTVVLDLEQSEPGEIDLAAVTAAAEATGGIEGADILAIHTGWSGHFDDVETYRRYPWLAAPVADWLLDTDVSLLAVDTISPDRPRAMRPPDWDDYPLHRTLLSEGVLIAEHLDLRPVAGERVTAVGFPLKLRGGDGAPARFAARRR